MTIEERNNMTAGIAATQYGLIHFEKSPVADIILKQHPVTPYLVTFTGW